MKNAFGYILGYLVFVAGATEAVILDLKNKVFYIKH